MSRRTLFSLLVPLVLIGAYFGVTAYIRAHVDDLIQHAVGRPLPAFELADRTGRKWSNADLAGKRAVLHFFRSYCSMCDAEAEAIRTLEQEAPSDVVWLHIMTDALLDVAPEVTAATIKKKGFTRPILMADQAFMEEFHKVSFSQVTPITYIVDEQGVVRFGLRGLQTVESVTKALQAVAG